MTIAEIKKQLLTLDKIAFVLPSGEWVPAHFHVTEVGKVQKNFIDCGGTIRNETKANFQLWEENDYDHRLHPEKLVHIIELSQAKLGLEDDLEIEVEYQADTIGKYSLESDGTHFMLVNKFTDCLAKDNCGIPEKNTMIDLSSSVAAPNSCTPGSGCC